MRLRCSPVAVTTSYSPRCCTATRPGTSPCSAYGCERGAPGVVPAERLEFRHASIVADGRCRVSYAASARSSPTSIVGVEKSKPASRSRAGSTR